MNNFNLLDEETCQHLRAWVNRQFRPQDRRGVYDEIMLFMERTDEPEYWLNKGWWAVFNTAGLNTF